MPKERQLATSNQIKTGGSQTSFKGGRRGEGTRAPLTYFEMVERRNRILILERTDA